VRKLRSFFVRVPDLPKGHHHSFLPLDVLLKDIRYAFRVLFKAPGFTLVAFISLMLGIGTNVVIFGALDAILLHPPDVRDPQSLFQIRHKAWAMGRLLTTSYPDFDDYRRRNSTFSDLIGIYGYSHAQLTWHNFATSLSGDEVTGNYFDVLGAQPEFGRFFHPSDEQGLDSAPYVVLSDAVWRRTFEADPGVVGSTVELDGHPFTVLGISPPQFHGTERFVWPDYWLPMVNEGQVEGSDYLHSRNAVSLTVIGRLKPSVTPQQATEDLNSIVSQLAKEYPQTNETLPLRLIHPGLIGDEGDAIRGFLYGVSVLALLVLAAGCANLASLFAARTVDRCREFALRIALGSSRLRLVRQLFIEAMILSLAGGAAAFGISRLLFGVLNRWHSLIENHLQIGIDARVYIVGLTCTLASAVMFSIAPVRLAWKSSPLSSFKNGSAGRNYFGRFNTRDILLGAQIAICTLLVTASLVATRGLMRVLQVPIGFKPQGAVLVDVDLPQTEQDGESFLEKQRAIIEGGRQIPGTIAVGAVSRTPFTGGMHGLPVFSPGTTGFKLADSVLSPYVFEISPEYFAAAGTHLLQGRDVSWDDTAKTLNVAVVNSTFAQRLWPHVSAIGRHFILQGKLTEVAGVVEDGKYHDLQESLQPVAYIPFAQSEQRGAVFVVRSRKSTKDLTAALQHTLSGIQPNVSINMQSWTDTLNSELFPAQAATVALGVMGLLAAMLAVTGTFGMAAYSVSRRMKELSIRVALGARKTDVLNAALGRPIILLSVGSIFGLLIGVLARPLLGRIVYQANPRDPVVVAGVVLTMVLLGLIASAIPARRALSADPSELMRDE
jgi:predicted permease